MRSTSPLETRYNSLDSAVEESCVRSVLMYFPHERGCRRDRRGSGVAMTVRSCVFDGIRR